MQRTGRVFCVVAHAGLQAANFVFHSITANFEVHCTVYIFLVFNVFYNFLDSCKKWKMLLDDTFFLGIAEIKYRTIG